ncbi:hypothetical protein F5148DRAFT_986622, partial [Russula earlei]
IAGPPPVRNDHLLINLGDFVDGSVNTLGDPLLSVTDPATPHVDFSTITVPYISDAHSRPTKLSIPTRGSVASHSSSRKKKDHRVVHW